MTYYHYPIAIEGEWVNYPGVGSPPALPPTTCFSSLNENNLIGDTTDYCTVEINDPTCCGYVAADGVYGWYERILYLDYGQLVNLDSAIAARIVYELLTCSPAGFDTWKFRVEKAAAGDDVSDPSLVSGWFALTPSIVQVLGAAPPVGFQTQDHTFAAGSNTRWLRIRTEVRYQPSPPLSYTCNTFNFRTARIDSETTAPLPPIVAGPRLWIYKSVDNGISWTSRGVMVA